MMASLTPIVEYALWKTWVWRFVRTAFSTALAQTLVIQVNWTEPQVAFRTLVVSLISGFFTALALAVRDQFGREDKSGLVQKIIF